MKKLWTFSAIFLLLWGFAAEGAGAGFSGGDGLSLTASSTSVRAGERVALTLSLAPHDAVQAGINAIHGTLEYDAEVFEAPAQENFTPLEHWESVYYNPENRQFVLFRREGDPEGGSLVEIQLDAKGDLPGREAQVGVSGVTASEGRGDVSLPDVSLSLSAVAGWEGLEPGSGGEVPPLESLAEKENEGPLSGTASDGEEGRSPDGGGTSPSRPDGLPDAEDGAAEEPAAGVSWAAALGVSGLVLLLAAGVLAARRSGRRRSGGGTLLTGVLLAAAAVCTLVGGVRALGGGGDLNGDGTVDYGDVYRLKKHLIALELLPQPAWKDADLNLDGALTVTDLSLLVQKVEGMADDQVQITSAMDRFYYEKQEEVALKFYAEVSHGGQISQVTVNGAEYPVQQTGGGAYTVQLRAAEIPGVQEFQITQVTLDHGRKVEVLHTEAIDVLKTAPSVEEFQVEEVGEAGPMRISFLLRDEDSALTGGTMEVFRHFDGEMVLEEEHAIAAGSHEFLLDLEEETLYTLYLSARYNRDSDTLEVQEDHRGSLNLRKEIQRNLPYSFFFGGLRAETEDGTETVQFHKNQPIVLRFQCGSGTEFLPERAVIHGVSYPVETAGTDCRVVLSGWPRLGTAELRVEAIVLENGVRFPVERDNQLVLTILKERPELSDLLVQENAEGRELAVSFRLTDPDRALANGNILVLDAGGAEVGRRAFGREDAQGDWYHAAVAPHSGSFTEFYTVKVLADQDLSADGTEPERQRVLAQQQIAALPRAQVTGSWAGADWVEKGGRVELFYRIEDNVEADLSAVVINHREWAVEPGPEGTWMAAAAAPGSAGVQELVLTQLIYDDGTAVEVRSALSLEVLKSAPAVEGFQVQEILEQGTAVFRFHLTDEDGAFQSGTARLLSQDGAEVAAEADLSAPGEQVLTWPVEEQTAYIVQILADWVRTEDGSQRVTGGLLAEESVYLVRDYGLRLSQLKTLAPDGAETVYYEPGSTGMFQFQAENAAGLAAERVRMNGRWYELDALDGNRYAFQFQPGSQPGVQILTLEALVLENGKELPVEEDCSVQVEVLKDAPQVERFSWSRPSAGELEVRFTLRDPHGALTAAQVRIMDGDGRLLAEESAAAGENTAAAALGQGEHALVQVTASFDRDTNALDSQSNFYAGQTLYSEAIAGPREAVQFKEITRAVLYWNDGSGAREIPVLDITSGLPEDVEPYYAVLEMEHLPDFYAGVRRFRQDEETGRVYAVLDQEDVISYGEDGVEQMEHAVPLAYRDASGTHPLMQRAEELFRQMEAQPGGSFELTGDLDASGLSPDVPAIAGRFTGTLDGNGYTIWNLPTALFDTLSGAEIRNLVLKDAQVTASHGGILANSIQDQSTVERVFLVRSSIANEVDGVGAFAGTLRGAAIRESASVDVSVKGLVAVGGIVGKTDAGAVIENCSVTGTVQGTYDHPTLGARAGGIAGWHGGGVIRSSFAQARIVAPAQKGNGGLIGGPNAGSPVLEDCLSLSTGAGYRIAGFDVLDQAKNLYEYAGSESATNINEANRDRIKETDAIYDQSLYTDALGWEEAVWNLELIPYGKRPSLRAAPERDNNYGIPAYDQVYRHADYRPQREQAYANLAKLMPFAPTAAWVEYGNRLPEGDPLAVRAVRMVLPLDGQGVLAVGLHREDLDSVQKIRIVYEEGPMEEYPVAQPALAGEITAVYTIPGTELKYQFPHYVGAPEEGLLSELTDMLARYDYAADLAALTSEEESRLYGDYYAERIEPDLEAVAAKVLLSQEEYPTYSDHSAIRALVRERAREESRWKELLYGYTYYDKWYRVDYQGVVLSDLLLFHGAQVAPGMTAASLTGQLLEAAPDQRATHQTVSLYNRVLKPYTRENLVDFLGALAQQLAGYDDPSDWFAQNFDGILKEQAPLHRAGELRYRIWDMLSGLNEGRQSIVLPILTAPQEDMYLISMPSQLMLGSLNRYPAYLNKDGQERRRMEEVIDAYAEKMGIFYGVSAVWMENAPELLNSFVNLQYDTRLNFPESPAAAAGDQNRDQTRDPVMKWVYEANNTISAKNDSAASADGTNVYWMQDAALGTSDYLFFTFSHETAHNQDGRYFYGGAGRREGTGGEAHADGNIAQEMRDGCLVFNISKINDWGIEMTNNFSYERINSPEKLWSYYREMFETGYVLDYLAAQAFLRLAPEEQAAVAVQAVHTPAGNRSLRTEYRSLTAEELRAMDLKDLEDLWTNRLSIRGGTETVGTATDGSYGFESFYCMNWYQSHNDSGSPDTHAFKRLGMEMLGLGGYEAYQIYMSARSHTDLDALRQITGENAMTWEAYKLGRFQTVRDNLHRVPYFDGEKVIQQFQEAFERDAQQGTRSEGMAVKRALYGIVKRATGDFQHGGIYEVRQIIPVTSAEELIHMARENPAGYYRLEADLDFSGISDEGGACIPDRFMGVLDGNGYTLYGLQSPLFGDLQYAYIKDLTLAQPAIPDGTRASLAEKARQTVVGEITVEGGTDRLPLAAETTGVYYEYGISSQEVRGPEIDAIQDIAA